MNRYLLALFCIMIVSVSFADDYRGLMNDGTKQYKDKNFANAADLYHQAEVLKPEDPRSAFNYGAALYKGKDNDKAAEKFSQTAGISQGEIKSDAYYNQGNALFQKQDYQGAMEAYKNSLLIDSQRQDAKFNYELAQSRLQQQQQQQQQQQNQDQQDKQKNKDQKDQKKQDQKQKQDQQKEQQQQQKQKQQQDQQKQEQQQAQPKKGEMTQQEAKDLLEAFKDDEKDIQKELKKFQVRPRSRRDW
jgi:Ca-activated chloride channel homolog